MPDDKETGEAREQSASEPFEPAPRGNVHSEPDAADRPGAIPPPLPN